MVRLPQDTRTRQGYGRIQVWRRPAFWLVAMHFGRGAKIKRAYKRFLRGAAKARKRL